MPPYKQLNQAGQTYPIRIKKSKFIASSAPINSVEEAKEFVARISNSHKKATHNVFAYRILEKNGINQNADDDGEPSHTAGDPILYVLEKQNVVNTVVVVTRYYGGIKLGKGGLIRAYSKTALELLKVIGLKEVANYA